MKIRRKKPLRDENLFVVEPEEEMREELQTQQNSAAANSILPASFMCGAHLLN